MTGGLASLKGAKPVPVSVDTWLRQPADFSPDGARILFAANHDGKQTDMYAFDRANGRVSQFTRTPRTRTRRRLCPAGVGEPGGFSVVQSEMDATQRLWRFNATARVRNWSSPTSSPSAITRGWTPINWCCSSSASRTRLQMASVKTGKGEVAADNIGRSLHRIPGTRLVSFVQHEPSGEYWVKQIDIDSKKIDPLIKAVEGSSDRDYAWMPDGKTILMSGGTKVYSWTRGRRAGPKCSTPPRTNSAPYRGSPCRQKAMRLRSWWRSLTENERFAFTYSLRPRPKK